MRVVQGHVARLLVVIYLVYYSIPGSMHQYHGGQQEWEKKTELLPDYKHTRFFGPRFQ